MDTSRVTPEQFEAAYLGIRHHQPQVLAGIPTVQAARLNPTTAHLINLHAWLINRGTDPYSGRRIHRRPEVQAPAAPHPVTATPARTRPTTLPARDNKRAAAGDRDD